MTRTINEQERILNSLTYKNKVFKNKLNITDREDLDYIEKKLVCIKAVQLPYSPIQQIDFNMERLKATNRFLLGDLYDFAGEIRKIDYYDTYYLQKYDNHLEFSSYENVEKDFNDVFVNLDYWKYLTDQEKIQMFSACVSDLYLVHPFYRCNAATIMLFSLDFAEKKLELNIDSQKLFQKYDMESLMNYYQEDTTILVKALLDCSIEKEKSHFFDFFPEENEYDEIELK